MKQSSEGILQAALDYAKQHSWHKTTVREISKEIGYSTIKIYSEFGSKENLLQEIQKKGFRLLRDEYSKAASSDDNAELQLIEICMAHLRFAQNFTEYYDLMFSSNETFCKSVSADILMQAAEPVKNVLEKVTASKDIKHFLHWFSLVHGFYEVTKKNDNKNETMLKEIVLDFIKGIK